MLVLGIETSGLHGSMALIRDEQCLAERSLNEVGRRHAQSLVLEVGQTLKLLGLSPRDVDLVAVSQGPGSFTGLRVGMVFAKTFAYATGCRFVAVETFEAIAQNVPAGIDRVFIVEDAQRSDLFVGEFHRRGADGWNLASPIKIASLTSFLQQRSPSDVVTGPGLRKLMAEQSQPTWLSDEAICRPRAVTIATLGRRSILSDAEGRPESATDFWQAKPFYLRVSAAEEKRMADEAAAGHQSPTLPSG